MQLCCVSPNRIRTCQAEQSFGTLVQNKSCSINICELGETLNGHNYRTQVTSSCFQGSEQMNKTSVTHRGVGRLMANWRNDVLNKKKVLFSPGDCLIRKFWPHVARWSKFFKRSRKPRLWCKISWILKCFIYSVSQKEHIYRSVSRSPAGCLKVKSHFFHTNNTYDWQCPSIPKPGQ